MAVSRNVVMFGFEDIGQYVESVKESSTFKCGGMSAVAMSILSDAQEQMHCGDGPAVVSMDGSEFWYKDGKAHRTDGPAIIRSDGLLAWYLFGELHREDGPAVIWVDDTQEWYLNGKRHRADGPAIIRSDGCKEWWLNGVQVDPLVHFLHCD